MPITRYNLGIAYNDLDVLTRFDMLHLVPKSGQAAGIEPYKQARARVAAGYPGAPMSRVEKEQILGALQAVQLRHDDLYKFEKKTGTSLLSGRGASGSPWRLNPTENGALPGTKRRRMDRLLDLWLWELYKNPRPDHEGDDLFQDLVFHGHPTDLIIKLEQDYDEGRLIGFETPATTAGAGGKPERPGLDELIASRWGIDAKATRWANRRAIRRANPYIRYPEVIKLVHTVQAVHVSDSDDAPPVHPVDDIRHYSAIEFLRKKALRADFVLETQIKGPLWAMVLPRETRRLMQGASPEMLHRLYAFYLTPPSLAPRVAVRADDREDLDAALWSLQSIEETARLAPRANRSERAEDAAFHLGYVLEHMAIGPERYQELLQRYPEPFQRAIQRVGAAVDGVACSDIHPLDDADFHTLVLAHATVRDLEIEMPSATQKEREALLLATAKNKLGGERMTLRRLQILERRYADRLTAEAPPGPPHVAAAAKSH
jgi:hypothetical protein